jgi:hypothetical protein
VDRSSAAAKRFRGFITHQGAPSRTTRWVKSKHQGCAERGTDEQCDFIFPVELHPASFVVTMQQ